MGWRVRDYLAQLQRANPGTILSVACPRCDVPAGESCRTSRGGVARLSHRARVWVAMLRGKA